MKFQNHPNFSIQDQRMIDHKASIASQKQLNRTELAAWISAIIGLLSLFVSLAK